jgi:ABC-2 type transport system permease protein
MIYRSPASLRVAFMTPLIFAAVIALFHQLRFETGTGQVNFFDYISVGVAFWYVTYTAEHGMTGAAAGYRAQGVLKRVAATPISSGTFITAQVLARVGLGVVQSLVVLGAARRLGAHIKLGANFAWELVPVTMIALAALSIGFIWAGITRTPGRANTLDVMAAIAILFLSGGMWPRTATRSWSSTSPITRSRLCRCSTCCAGSRCTAPASPTTRTTSSSPAPGSRRCP